MRSPVPVLTALALAAAATIALAPAADAAPNAKSYANCAAIHRVYSGGIAKKGVKQDTVHTGGRVSHRALKGHVKFSTPLYLANRKSDRDHDGIACEKS